MSVMDVVLPYIRLRQGFGRQPQFVEDHGRSHCNLKAVAKNRKRVQRKVYVEKSVQAIAPIKNTLMNSNRPVYKGWNYHHKEGGWAKDVSVDEPDIIVRARKKLEKDEAFQNIMPILTENVEELVKHNNSMLVFSDYYKEKYHYPEDKKCHPFAHVICDFSDPTGSERAVSHICWANDYGRIGVGYCPFDFDPLLRSKPTDAYFFDIEIPSRPEAMIICPSNVTELHYHPKDPHSVVASMYNGQVATWDNRVSKYPQGVSGFDVSHGDICTTATWINSKTGTELMSGGLDGQVIWWDERWLDRQLDQTWLDTEKGQCRPELAVGCTVLQYDHTLPTKFVAGTERGNIMFMMKKGKSPSERLVNCYNGHRGRVRTLHRNPLFIKNILSCGQDCLRIFSEDCRESSIMWTAPTKAKYSYAQWIPTRPSVIVASRSDGRVDFWDLNKHPAVPYLTTRISRDQLTCLWPSDTGKLIAVGTNKGKIRLLKPADHMTVFAKRERGILSTVFERETRREKFLEQRHREVRLRKRDKDKLIAEKKKIMEERSEQVELAKKKEAETGEKVPLPDYSGGRDFDIAFEALNDKTLNVQRQFYRDIMQEMSEKGLDAFADKKSKHDLQDEEEEEEEDGRRESGEMDDDENEVKIRAPVKAAEIGGEDEQEEGEAMEGSGGKEDVKVEDGGGVKPEQPEVKEEEEVEPTVTGGEEEGEEEQGGDEEEYDEGEMGDDEE